MLRSNRAQRTCLKQPLCILECFVLLKIVYFVSRVYIALLASADVSSEIRIVLDKTENPECGFPQKSRLVQRFPPIISMKLRPNGDGLSSNSIRSALGIVD